MEKIKQFEPFFGEWYAESFIGAGSFGRVYKIYREEFGERYYSALKYISIPADDYEVTSLRDDGMDDESITTYYTALAKDVAAETRLMSKLKGYSNIVSYEDSRVIPKTNGFGYDIFIRMELLENLPERTRKAPFTQADVVSLGIDICTALEVCGEHGIIHRDIKPDNIFINSHGDYKLGDFGIARQLEKTATFMSKKGTYNYMAPEVYRGEKYGAACDIYSLGLVMYRLLNKNRLPFFPQAPLPITPADKEKALLDRLSGKPMGIPCNADENIARIICKACSFIPEDRYSSPRIMKDELIQIKYMFSGKPAEAAETNAVVSNMEQPESISDSGNEDDATSGVFISHSEAFIGARQVSDIGDSTLSILDSIKTEDQSHSVDSAEIRQPLDSFYPDYKKTDRPFDDAQQVPLLTGDSLLFGSYFQSYSKEPIDSKEPIEWLVLEKKGNKALIISKYAIDCRPFEARFGNARATWESCSLREWLNTAFLNEAFSDSEKSCIMQICFSNENKQTVNHCGKNDSIDRVFLLSISEAKKYFPAEKGLQCIPTDFAIVCGARYSSEKGCCWWLRSSGSDKYRAAYVHYDGSIYDCNVDNTFVAVRPVMWIELDN